MKATIFMYMYTKFNLCFQMKQKMRGKINTKCFGIKNEK